MICRDKLNKVQHSLNMALVSYDYGSGSENEDEEPSSSCIVINNKATDTLPQLLETKVKVTTSKDLNGGDQIEQSEEVSSTISMFSILPETKTKRTELIEVKIEDFIPRVKPETKGKLKVKITIPPISQFESNEDAEPQVKKAKPSNKCSSLLSLLPPVKGTPLSNKSFVPNVVTQKNKVYTQKPTTKSLVPRVVRKNAETKKTELLKKTNKIDSDIESEDEIEMPETFDDEMWEKVCGRPKPIEIIKEPEEIPSQEFIELAPEPVKPYDGLDNAAFKELVGKSKRPVGNIKLIDINEEEILPEKDLWMTKSLTDPECVPKASIEDPVDPTRRKKHHITYLAQQAKANEQELQTQWAANKYSRNQTRAKYGF